MPNPTLNWGSESSRDLPKVTQPKWNQTRVSLASLDHPGMEASRERLAEPLEAGTTSRPIQGGGPGSWSRARSWPIRPGALGLAETSARTQSAYFLAPVLERRGRKKSNRRGVQADRAGVLVLPVTGLTFSSPSLRSL